MKRIVFFTLMILHSSLGHTCVVELFHKYIKPSNIVTYKVSEIIKRSDCSSEIKRNVADLVFKLEGTVTSAHITRILKSDGIRVIPDKIRLRNLDSILQTYYSLPTRRFFRNAKLKHGRNIVTYSDSANVEVVCKTCEGTGRADFYLRIVDTISGRKKDIWGHSDIVLQEKSLVANRTLSPGRKLLSEDVIEKVIYHANPGKLFKSRKNIRFYKTNKAVLEGTPIKTSDLSPIYLVKPSTPVKLNLKNSGIVLNSVGMPLQAGTIGELIQLKNTRSNKTVVGKVVDFNSVRVEL